MTCLVVLGLAIGSMQAGKPHQDEMGAPAHMQPVIRLTGKATRIRRFTRELHRAINGKHLYFAAVESRNSVEILSAPKETEQVLRLAKNEARLMHVRVKVITNEPRLGYGE